MSSLDDGPGGRRAASRAGRVPAPAMTPVPPPRQPAPSARPAVLAAGLAVAMGAVQRAAWALGLVAPPSGGAQALSSRPASTLLLMLAGGALALLAAPQATAWRRRAGQLLALALVALAAVGLRSPEAPAIAGAVPPPVAVAPGTALAFLLLGLALLALEWTPRPLVRPSELLAIPVQGLCCFWSSEALLGDPALADPFAAPRPALLTAAALLVLSVGVLSARSRTGLVGLLGAGFPGAAGRLRQALLALLLGLLLAAGGLLSANEERTAMADAATELESVSALKLEQLLTWRTERLHDGLQLVGRPTLVDLLQRWSTDLADHPGIEERIRAELEPMLSTGLYANLFLLDGDDQVHLDLAGTRPELTAALRAAMARARASGAPELAELAWLQPGQRPVLDVVAPVRSPGPGGRLLGLVVLRVDPEAGLFQPTARWPTPARTGEALLTTWVGGRLRALDRRGFAEPPLELTLPRLAPGQPWVGPSVGRDQRGAAVVAHLRPVPGTGWVLVTRMNLEEIAGRWRARSSLVVAVVTLLSLLLAGALVFLAGEQQRLRQLAEADQRTREQEERFSKAFEHSPLPKAIATLDDGVFREVNEAFLRMNGYRREEVLGRSALALQMWPDPQARQALVADLRAGREVSGRPLTMRVKGGGLRQVHFWASQIVVGGVPHLYSTLVDVTERQAEQAALAQFQDRYRQTIELTGTGYVVLDGEGRVVEANQVYLRMTGLERLEDLLGRSVVEWTAPEAQAANAAAVAQVVRDGAIHDFETVYLRRDGSRLGLSINARVEQTPQGPRVVSLCRDISGRMRLEAEQRALVERLRRSNAELEQFAFVASHDLQEPARKVLAFGELLKEDLDRQGGASAEVADSVGRMQAAARRMNALIHNLLDYSRVTTRAVPFQPVSLDAVLGTVAEDYKERLAQAGGRLVVGPLPALEADAQQLVQLFENLVGNALKYRRKEVPPEVVVRGEVAGGACRITVEDNGIGFEQQYAERIFGIFQRLHGRQEYEGTGIGLAICRKIVERHRGTITALGRPGEGATFIISLPLTQPSGTDEPLLKELAARDAAGGS